jgi:cephalosporin hydroxylase
MELGEGKVTVRADVMATQEVIWATKPGVIIETSVARGGSVLFMASLLEMMGHLNWKHCGKFNPREVFSAPPQAWACRVTNRTPYADSAPIKAVES